MARKWTADDERRYRDELVRLYVTQNKTLCETAACLGVKEQTVYQRLVRLGIGTCPERKKNFLNRRTDAKLPERRSDDLAEFFGIMLGDGHVSHFQVLVHLGTKEAAYAEHVRGLIRRLFRAPAKVAVRSTGYRDVYLGSTLVTSWLLKNGLVGNKVKSQVGVPPWIAASPAFAKHFLRGFFDTDGSVYKLRFGVQIAFTNYSMPLLEDLQKIISVLEYTPSAISGPRFYLTKQDDVRRFFREIRPKNPKHVERFQRFIHAPVG